MLIIETFFNWAIKQWCWGDSRDPYDNDFYGRATKKEIKINESKGSQLEKVSKVTEFEKLNNNTN